MLCFIYMRKKYPLLRLSKEDMRISGCVSQIILDRSVDGFYGFFVNLGTLAPQTSINTFGTNIIVAHTAARKATSIFMLPFSVLGTTLATYCGQNLGAGKFSRIKAGIRDTVLLTFGCVCVRDCDGIYDFSTVSEVDYIHVGEGDYGDTASLYLKVNTSFYFVPAVICLFRNSMQGFGDSKTPVFSSSLELIGKVLIAFWLAPAIGYMELL